MKKENDIYMKITLVVAMLFLIVFTTYVVTYAVKSKAIDNEIEHMHEDMDIDEIEGMQIMNVYVYLKENNNKKIDIDDIVNYDVEAGEVVDIKVKYDGMDKVVKKQAYISINEDENEKEVQYQDGDFGQIVIPKKEDK